MQRERADDLVEQPLHHHVQSAIGLVENVDHRDVADDRNRSAAAGSAACCCVRTAGCRDGQHQSFSASCEDAGSQRLQSAARRSRDRRSVWRANSTDVVDDASFLRAWQLSPRCGRSPRSSNTPSDAHVRIALRGEASLQPASSPVTVGADDDGAAIEAALARPVPNQQEQRTAKRDQRAEAEDVETANQTRVRIDRLFWQKMTPPMANRKTTDQADASRMYCLRNGRGGADPIDVGGLEREHREGAMPTSRRRSARQSRRAVQRARHMRRKPTSATSAGPRSRSGPCRRSTIDRIGALMVPPRPSAPGRREA